VIHFTGDEVPLSPFCMTNVGEWDKFRNIDMDKEVFLLLLFTNAHFNAIEFDAEKDIRSL
jgi:hypothetical protein